MALGGCVLPGFSAVMLMLLLGRIAGISVIATGVLGAVVPVSGAPEDRGWRVAFVAGLIAAPLVVTLAGLWLGRHAKALAAMSPKGSVR